MTDTEKRLKILRINTKLERLSKKYSFDVLAPYYNKIESVIGSRNVVWKTYSNGRKVLGISASKYSLPVETGEALNFIENYTPSLTTFRSESSEAWVEEQTLEGSEKSIDEFINYKADIEKRLQRFLNSGKYKEGDNWFFNSMPRKHESGQIITWGRIERELTKYGY